MKKQFLYKIFFVAVILTFGSCNDPIFYNISMEEKILEPLIKGSPTNFVKYNGYMYVASGTELYRYEGTSDKGKGIWKLETRPGGSISALAVTADKLYALCAGSSGRKILKVSNDGKSWSNVEGLGSDLIINTVYAANNQLFVGAGKPGSYFILFYGGDSSRELANTEHKMLNGAAYNDGFYYLSAKDLITDNGGGIYIIEELNLSAEAPARLLGNGSFAGIINTNLSSNPVKAITRKGTIYTLTPGAIFQTGTSMGNRMATGALAVWEDKNDSSRRLLLAGRQDTLGTTVTSGYTYGYLELAINTSGDVEGNFVEPGISGTSTVDNGDNGRYQSTIGKYPVNHIFQADDGILFASTQKNGVWSYRDRKGWSWNAEEE